MCNFLSLIFMSITLFGCQATLPQANKGLTYTAPPKLISAKEKKPKAYGYWAPAVSKILCLTGGVAVSYDDTLGLLKQGIFDELAKGYKWENKNQLKIIKSSSENIASTAVYSIQYKFGSAYIKQRVVFGGAEGHQKLNSLDKSLVEDGYKRMGGELSFGNELETVSSVCWGISAADRLKKNNSAKNTKSLK